MEELQLGSSSIDLHTIRFRETWQDICFIESCSRSKTGDRCLHATSDNGGTGKPTQYTVANVLKKEWQRNAEPCRMVAEICK